MARSSPHQNYTNGHSATLPRNTENHQLAGSENESQLDDLDRGRQRKKRDFFGTLKRRLGRSKTRTKSVDRGIIPLDSSNPTGEARSVSADRSLVHNNSNINTSTGWWWIIVVFLIVSFFTFSYNK